MAAGRLGDAAKDALPEVDLADKATDAVDQATAAADSVKDLDPTDRVGASDGSGAFGSTPMEMNDLSTGSAAALADRADALAARAGEVTGAVGGAAET